jgi:hypothetical protein
VAGRDANGMPCWHKQLVGNEQRMAERPCAHSRLSHARAAVAVAEPRKAASTSADGGTCAAAFSTGRRIDDRPRSKRHPILLLCATWSFSELRERDCRVGGSGATVLGSCGRVAAGGGGMGNWGSRRQGCQLGRQTNLLMLRAQ